jgi:small conductance mechanosensitive channel
MLSKQVSQVEVEELIRLLEDEQAREQLTRRLKALAALQAGDTSAEAVAAPGMLQRVIGAVELTIRQTLGASQAILRWLLQVPQQGRQLIVALSDPETRWSLWLTIQQLAMSLLLGAVTLIILRWRFRPLAHRTRPDTAASYRQRLWHAILHVLVHVLPTVGLLVVTLVCARLVKASPSIQQTLRFLLSTVLFYQVAIWCVWVTLVPENIQVRLVPLTNEKALYFWIWGRRFLRYSVLYALVMCGLRLLYEDPDAYQGVRGFLLLTFPTMVTIVVAQLVRHRTQPTAASLSESSHRVVYTTTRRVLYALWPFLVILYAWALTGFLIAHHTSGVSYLFWSSITTAVTALVLILALRLFNHLYDRAVDVGDRIQQRYPALQEKANRYLEVLRTVCNVLLILLAAGIILELWGVPASWFFTSPFGSQLLSRVVLIALAVGVTIVVIGISRTLADLLTRPILTAQGESLERGRKRRTLVPLADAILKVSVIFLAMLVVLEQLGVSTGPIIAGVGILGLAVGFGSQSLIKDVINGLFILFEDSLSVGDIVMLRGNGGQVERVTLRSVTIRDLGGNVHVIPNGSIDMVTNMTKEFSRYILDVGVAYRENVDTVIAILKEIDEGMRSDPAYSPDMLEPIEILGLDRFDDSAVVIRARLKTKPMRQWRTGREFNRRMKKVFDERGIEIPFPHRTLYWGLPKDGSQLPISIAVEDRHPTHKEN